MPIKKSSMHIWLLIVTIFAVASLEVYCQSFSSSFSLDVLKSCRTGECIAGSNGIVSVGVSTGEFGSSPCAPKVSFGVCPGEPLFKIGSFLTYKLILLDAKNNAPRNYAITVPMTCTNGILRGVVNTRISGYYRIQAIAFYNGNNPPNPGSIENLDCTNQNRNDDPMIVQIMPGVYAFAGNYFQYFSLYLLQPTS
jgi:hypothetical protein